MKNNAQRSCVFIILLCLLSTILINLYKLEYLFRKEKKLSLNRELNKEKQAVDELNIEEQHSITKVVEQYIESSEIKGITPIDIKLQSVEKDAYNRYLAQMQVLGVDESKSIDVYDYYVVVEKTNQEDVFTIPMGIEVVPSNKNALEDAVVKSMVKVMNGWGLSHEDVQLKWRKQANTEEK